MTKLDHKRLLAQAICDAIDWRETLADGNTAEQVEKCNSLAARYRTMLKKIGIIYLAPLPVLDTIQ